MSTTWLTTAEVAAQIRMSEEYVARQCAIGHIKGKKLGTQWRVSEEALAVFMAGDSPAPSPRIGRSARQRRRTA